LAEHQQIATHEDAVREPSGLRRPSLVREVNDQIERLGERIHVDGILDVLCECIDPDCMHRLRISRDDYETVRSTPTRFIVIEEHRRDDRVVASGDGYVVIEKSGQSALRAVEVDPRRRR
jgi:hypothetical protein